MTALGVSRGVNYIYYGREVCFVIECVKMHSNGNDFLILDNMDLCYNKDFMSNFALKACRRRIAVGADGLLVIEPSNTTAFKMRIFNPDGTEGEMCGNGARCASLYAAKREIVYGDDFIFETLGGTVHASLTGDMVTLDVAPILERDIVTDGHIIIDGIEYEYYFIPVGVPHCVIFERKRNCYLENYIAVGRTIRNRFDVFPQGTHVNFVVVEDEPDTINVVTYERGVEDITLSCGTGSIASAAASWISGKTGNSVHVKTPGGDNRVELTSSLCRQGEIFPTLSGKAVFVASISIFDKMLEF